MAPGSGSQEPNPLTRAEEDEAQARLRQELGRLGAADRELWDLLAEGIRLRQVAAALGISYDVAKRRRRNLLARLKLALTGEPPPAAPRASRRARHQPEKNFALICCPALRSQTDNKVKQ